MVLSMPTGLLFEYLYDISPEWSVNTHQFQEILQNKEKKADLLVNKVLENLKSGNDKALQKITRETNGISLYFVKNGQLVFWNDNHIDFNIASWKAANEYKLKLFSNAFCIEKNIRKDSFDISILIFLKHNFPYENDVLRNSFDTEFDLNDKIKICEGNKNDQNAIFNSNGNYLFTLESGDSPVFDQKNAIYSFCFYVLAVVLLLILLANYNKLIGKKSISVTEFFIVFIVSGLLISLSLWFKKPDLLYWDQIFSAQQYAYNPLLSSITHLSIVSLFLLAVSYLFYFGVKLDDNNSHIKAVIIQSFVILYFVVVYQIIKSLIFHSGVQLNIVDFKEISFVAVYLHVLILLFGVGFALIFFKVHNLLATKKLLKKAIITDLIFIGVLCCIYFLYSPTDALKVVPALFLILTVFYIAYLFKQNKAFNWLLPVWILVYTCIFIFSSMIMNNEKKAEKYKLVAQNIMMNGNLENDRMTEIMLEELDGQLISDKHINKVASNPDSVLVANNYLNKNFLRGYWNKFEMRLNIAVANSELYLQFQEMIRSNSVKINHTHFYKIPASRYGMAYLGIFRAENRGSDSIFYFLQFFPRRNFKSYSFPGFLLSPVQDMPGNLGITVSKYENSKLVYSTGTEQMPANSNWFNQNGRDYKIVNYNSQQFYIYSQGKGNHIMISENEKFSLTASLLYFIYTFLFFYTTVWLLVRIHVFLVRKQKPVIGFTTRFQYAFLALLIVSFVGIFYVSVNFIKRNYRNEQISKIENKKKYIQSALQNLYYWSQDLSEVNTQALNLDLQELSYLYQTDIHVYSNEGNLLGSSQPLIFNKNLISTHISPVPFFSDQPDLTHYESIGKLKYLVSYTDFYNGDFLQIGFIALPQFLSQEEIQSQITGFLSVIIHIYLIVVFLVIFLSLLIGKQLSAPLIMIENKLKLMRFGHRNEKIDYQYRDEIGQLVEQYNRTVDELEKSARQLAKTERESAWKSMARQIAHEINNPLTPMKLTIQQLQRTFNTNNKDFEEYFRKSTSVLIEQIDNLSRIAASFSNFAKLPEAQFRRVDIAAKLSSVVRLFANNHDQTEVIYEGENEGIYVFADPEQLTQVFNNLLKNAIQAIPDDKEGRVEVTLKKVGDEIQIKIKDNGPGISPEVAEKMFMPNFTTKSTGMGLGLAISKNIIEIAGGKIDFISDSKAGGATFIVCIPGD